MSNSKDCGCGCGGCADNPHKIEDPLNLVKAFVPEKSHQAMMAAAGITAAPAPVPTPVPPANPGPGSWAALPPQQGVDVDSARVLIEGRPAPVNLYVPPQAHAASVKAIAPGFAGNTVAGPASISELSRALKSNVDLIYEWVFNNIENIPSYGSQKGALGALIDGYGNSFDQADLMIQLLQAAGYTCSYQFGTLRMNAAQAGAWLGTDPTNIWASNNYLANSGVPVSVVNIGGVDGVEFSHCWALVNISGTNYVFDPVQKTYTTKSAINLATAMGFNATTFMSDADSGATITADYVQNINRTNIRNDLATMTGNLVTWIKANNPAAGLDDILGGRNIVQYDASVPLRQTAHPYLKSGTTPTTWASIPQAYKATLHVVYDTINITFNSADLAGQRLTLTFNGSNQGELRLNGTLLGTSTAQSPGSWNSVLFDIVHPYPGTWANQYVWEQVWALKPYLLCNSWGNLGPSATAIHGRNIKALEASFAPQSGEPMVGETMAQMWRTMDAMLSRMADITNRMSNCATVFHHQCGLIGWYDTASTNIGAIAWGTSALDNNYNQQQANDTNLAMHGVALEAQIAREFQTVLGVSTTSIIDKAVQGGQKIYRGNSSNWVGTVQPALVNYNAGDLSFIQTNYINNGYQVMLPQNGQVTLTNWTGFGYYAIPTYGTYGIIGGGLKGGSGSQTVPLAGLHYLWTEQNWDVYMTNTFPPPDCALLQVAYNASVCGPWAGQCICWVPSAAAGMSGYVPWLVGTSLQAGSGGGGSYSPSPIQSAEPIDMVSGAYTLDATDISVGSAGFPYGLAFSRSYNSSALNQHGPLGRGWRHNYQVYASRDTSGFAGMGGQNVLGAAGTIVEAFVTYSLQTDLTKPIDKYLACALANQWFVDNLSDNVVTIQSGFSGRTFVKLPDGTYASPARDAGTLTISGGLFTYTSLTGQKMNFNSYGHLATIVDPSGWTVTLTYDSYAKLISVSNGMGRTLTLTYANSGNDNLLASVSDGNGRSVSYTIDANANLTTVTDPNSKNWTYQYDQPGRLTKLFKPANPATAVATNVYDSLNRVKQQQDYQGNTWNYYFAGSRSEEVNPNSKSWVTYYDSNGNCVKSINQVGNISKAVFDALGRLSSATAPEGNSVSYVYDSKHRVTQTTAVAKSGSGLSNIVTSATYDPTWGKVKTTTDNLGRVTTLNYDPANGNLLSVVSPAVTGLGSSTVSMTYNGRGQVLTVTAPDGMVNQNTYDVSTEKLLSTVVDYGVGRLNLTANFGYDAVGNVTSVQDPRGYTSTANVDVLRRVYQTTTTAPWSFVTKFTFDDNGNTIKVEKQTNDPATPWQTVQASFTADNKVSTTTDPLGNVTTVTYDNLQRRWKVTDALSRVVTTNYDDANRVSTVVDPASITAITYTYTNNGLVATIKDARNNTTTNSFDGFDRAKRTTYADSTYEEVTTYDGNSNPTLLTTRSGATVTLTYDELNRVKTKAPTSQPTVTTVYDIAGRVTSISTPVVAGDPSSGTFSKFYDTAGRFYKEQYPDTLSITHVLDANGNITQTTYPDGYYISRVFDELNRLTDIKLNGATTSAINFQYDALSRRTKLTYENGCTASYTVDYGNRLTNLLHNFVGSNVGFSYGYDNGSQMATQRTTDPANFRWTPGTPATVSYGTANNINQYPTVGGTSYSYTTDGNLSNDGTFKYFYNTERMLTQVQNAGTSAVIANYLYDPTQRQRQKNVGGTKTNYYYAGFQRLADYDGTSGTPGILLNRYVYGLGMDEVLIQVSSGGTKTYFHSNHQGSVAAITNSSGNVLTRYAYGPFGESAALTGTTHGYTGQRYDAETGLYYYKMRHYSSKLGGFLQPDPIGLAGGSNLYSYVNSSPLLQTDSTGLAPLSTLNIPAVPIPNDGYQFPAFLGASDVTYNVVLTLCERDHMPLTYLANFYNRVKPGGIWDYKAHVDGFNQLVAQNFGNFNFGAVAWALGINVTATQMAAGGANVGATIIANVKAILGQTNRFYTLGDGASWSTYGDQQRDYLYVLAGYQWAQTNAVKLNKLKVQYCNDKMADSGNDSSSIVSISAAAPDSNVSVSSANSLLQFMGLIPTYTGAVNIVSGITDGLLGPSGSVGSGTGIGGNSNGGSNK